MESGATHTVICAYCNKDFDLFGAVWCSHTKAHQSKVCPHCGRCLCTHPLYANPNCWKEAPMGFQAQGFRKLFLLYI